MNIFTNFPNNIIKKRNSLIQKESLPTYSNHKSGINVYYENCKIGEYVKSDKKYLCYIKFNSQPEYVTSEVNMLNNFIFKKFGNIIKIIDITQLDDENYYIYGESMKTGKFIDKTIQNDIINIYNDILLYYKIEN